VGKITIDDPGLNRTIHIVKEGSRTTVVWNPDVTDALMGDVGAGQHRRFVCVEAANAADDVVAVPAGSNVHLAMEIWTEPGAGL
jgi:glucose-6-phosphate 1-epimerase